MIGIDEEVHRVIKFFTEEVIHSNLDLIKIIDLVNEDVIIKLVQLLSKDPDTMEEVAKLMITCELQCGADVLRNVVLSSLYDKLINISAVKCRISTESSVIAKIKTKLIGDESYVFVYILSDLFGAYVKPERKAPSN